MELTMRNMVRFATLLFVAALATPLLGQSAPPASGQLKLYVIVLKDPRHRPAKAEEPDVTKFGGLLQEKWGSRRIVRLPEAAAEQLQAHPAVKYLQAVVEDRKQTTAPPPGMQQDDGSDGSGAWEPPTWFSGDYQFDSSGNIRAIGSPRLNSDGKTNRYVYDTAGRLVQADVNHETNDVQKYEYDSFGNRIRVQTSNGSLVDYGVEPASNKLAQGVYDASGNLTESAGVQYAYDAFNMLRIAYRSNQGDLEVVTELYTADDERIAVQERNGTRWTIRDFEGNVLREYMGASPSEDECTYACVWSWTEDWVYQEGKPVAGERPALKVDGDTSTSITSARYGW